MVEQTPAEVGMDSMEKRIAERWGCVFSEAKLDVSALESDPPCGENGDICSLPKGDRFERQDVGRALSSVLRPALLGLGLSPAPSLPFRVTRWSV